MVYGVNKGGTCEEVVSVFCEKVMNAIMQTFKLAHARKRTRKRAHTRYDAAELTNQQVSAETPHTNLQK